MGSYEHTADASICVCLREEPEGQGRKLRGEGITNGHAGSPHSGYLVPFDALHRMLLLLSSSPPDMSFVSAFYHCLLTCLHHHPGHCQVHW